jgi:hypothetical protein
MRGRLPDERGDEVPCGVMINKVARLKHDKGERQLPCTSVRPTDSRGDRDRWMEGERPRQEQGQCCVLADDYVLSSSSDIERPVASQTEIPLTSQPSGSRFHACAFHRCSHGRRWAHGERRFPSAGLAGEDALNAPAVSRKARTPVNGRRTTEFSKRVAATRSSLSSPRRWRYLWWRKLTVWS